MIPLLRPAVPTPEEIAPYLRDSFAQYSFTNFGPAWWGAVKRLKQRTGKHCLPVSSGMSALQLIIQSKFPRGTRIVLPDYTHIATLQAISSAGCWPILAPVSKKDWLIDIDYLLKCKEEYKAVIVVSPFGYNMDFQRYDDFGRQYKKKIIYDLAGGWGITITDTKNPVMFSMHATKNFSIGEGGIACFHTEEEWERARKLSNFDTLPDRSVKSEWGGNFKIDEYKAAMIHATLDTDFVISRKIARKRRHLDFYMKEIKAIDIDMHRPILSSAPSMCVIPGLPAKKLEAIGPKSGVIFKQYYPLLSRMEGLRHIEKIGVSSSYFDTCCALPSDCMDNELDKVVAVVRKLFKE